MHTHIAPGHDIVARFGSDDEYVYLAIPTSNFKEHPFGFEQYRVDRTDVVRAALTPTSGGLNATPFSGPETMTVYVHLAEDYLRMLAGAIRKEEVMAMNAAKTDMQWWESMNNEWVNSR